MRWLARRRCAKRGHDWFPSGDAREFIPTQQVCMRCRATHVLLPWGDCLSRHPLRDHYDSAGNLVPVEGCSGPR